MERTFPTWSKALCMALLLVSVTLGRTGEVSAQNRTVKGVVVSAADNEPLIGVAVVVEGTATGTTTGVSGDFSLSLPAGKEALTFSFLGYKTQTVDATGRTELQVALAEDNTSLDEVVVVGYGVQKKKLTTGANLNIKGDELMKRSTTGALQAMQGQTPGVQITSTSGQPGQGMKVTIRGMGRIGSSGPLYVIDGVIGDITKINPADIESIDVLKDAASSAIYGSQAAGGVVLVTTKGGKKGSASVYYDGYYGIQTLARKTNMLNAEQYKTIMDEQSLNSGGTVYDWDALGYGAGCASTDWVGAMFQNAATQNHTVGVNGGTDNSVYAISFNYTDQEGIVGGKDFSNYSKYGFRVNTEHKIYGDILKVGQHLNFAHVETTGIAVGGVYSNSLRGAFSMSPLAPIYGSNPYDLGDEKGTWNDTSSSTWNTDEGNPYAEMRLSRSITKEQSLFGDVYAEFQPVKGLKIRSAVGLSYASSRYHGFTPEYQFSSYSVNNLAEASQSMSNGYTLSWTNTATYDVTIAQDHNLSAMIGSEWSTNDGESMYGKNTITTEQFKDFAHAWLSNTTSSTENMSMTGAPYDVERAMSVFARVGYNYKEKYMVNVTFRADGSSKFAAGNRWGYFPSVSAGWVVTEEKFLKRNNTLSFLKIRASWGQVGNKNVGNYMYTAPIVTQNVNYVFGPDLGTNANVGGSYQSRLDNPDIKWETSEQLDLGFDARLFDNRLDVNFDWYRKVSKDWLVEAPILATAGTGAPYINGGDVKNTGVEVALNWHASIGKDFNYYVGGNFAYNKNRVGSIPNADGVIYGGYGELFDNSDYFYRAENGHSIGYWWGYQTAGIFQNQEQIDAWRAAGNGILQSDVQPGDVIFVDQNHDGVIDTNDKIDLGNGMPSWTFGFNLGFDYKGFDFNLQASGVAGNKLVQAYRNPNGNTKGNYTTAVLNRWTGEGTSNSVPRVTEQNVNYAVFSDLFLQDGDYLRITNLTVGYDFARLIKRPWASQLRLYFSVQNLCTFTKYDGMDPEVGYGPGGSSDNGDSWVTGVDVGYYPHPRTYLIGANIKF